MQAKDFGESSPGELVQATASWGPDVAFVPTPLPPPWEFPEEIWPTLHAAGNLLNKLDGIGSTLPNPALLLRPLRDREAILSSRMEGTYATPRELLLFERGPGDPGDDDESRNQQREVFNYTRALDLAMRSEFPLGLPLIRQMHSELMWGVRGRDKQPGEFRSWQVGIGKRGKTARFVPPPPEQLHDCLEDLDTYLHRESWKYDPLVECFLVHYQLETIHPFSDGNGRVGRLLLTIMIQRLCGLSQPWLHMSEYFERDHEKYCHSLYEVSAGAAWSDWVEYCLEGVAWLAERTIDRCNKLQDLRADFSQRVQKGGGSVRLQQIVEKLFLEPLVSVADLSRELGKSYPTAGADLKKLAAVGIIDELPNHRPRTYYAPEIFAIAYEGLE